jgi:AcrR family transcriptional regulator
MSDTDVRRRPGGRSARVRQSVSEAALEVLAEQGADALTIGDVAARAGVHETSIYRRWGTRENLIIDALLSNSAQLLPIPDTGSLRPDLIGFATSLAAYLRSPLGGALARALASSSNDPATGEARERFWEGRYALASQMITRAVERGDLPQATDPQLALEALIGPLHFRALLTAQPIDQAFVARLVDVLLDGLSSAG